MSHIVQPAAVIDCIVVCVLAESVDAHSQEMPHATSTPDYAFLSNPVPNKLGHSSAAHDVIVRSESGEVWHLYLGQQPRTNHWTPVYVR